MLIHLRRAGGPRWQRAPQAVLDRVYYRLPEPWQRAFLRRVVWAADAGWAWQQQSADSALWRQKRQVAVDHVCRLPGVSRHLVEIGCGNGRLLAWLAQARPAWTFAGIDLHAGQVAANRARYPHLSFRAGDALTAVTETSAGDAILTYGVLAYCTPRELRAFFRLTADRGCDLVVSEPVRETWEGRQSAPRGRFQYAHPYQDMAEDVGYVTVAETRDPTWRTFTFRRPGSEAPLGSADLAR